ncbi:hypothetical protein [Maribacter sp.]|uniref:hypothetical protein n=1 Tax=Maribacter sp. TaxID=1897614 RepID=UPI0025B8A2A8|nr:hypothetical protein [Maribacter sp.]
MALLVEKFFTELKKYEKEGTDSSDLAHYFIDEIVEKFNPEDWCYVKKNYKDKSDNIKLLIAGHIHLKNIDLADIQLEILIQIILAEQIVVAYEALREITFRFVTSGRNYETNEFFYKEELKGIFLSKRKLFLVNTFFTKKFIDKVLSIASECGEVQRNEILKFLEIINALKQ